MHLASLATKREAHSIPRTSSSSHQNKVTAVEEDSVVLHKPPEEPPIAAPSPKLMIEPKAQMRNDTAKTNTLEAAIIATGSIGQAKASAKNPDVVTSTNIASTSAPAAIDVKINTLRMDNNPSSVAVGARKTTDTKMDGLAMMEPMDVPERIPSRRKMKSTDPPPLPAPGAVHIFPNAVTAQASLARIMRTTEASAAASSAAAYAASSPTAEDDTCFIPIDTAKVTNDDENDEILLVDALTDEQIDLAAKRRKRKLICIFLGFALVVIILAVSFGVVYGVPEPDIVLTTEPTPTPSQAPTFSFTRENLMLLVNSILPSVSFDDPTSAQSLALEWMVGDSYSQSMDRSDEYKLLQRFSLATVWYSMNGQGWDHEDWLTSVDECEWGGVDDDLSCDRGVVTSIDLNDDGVSGSIPVEVILLTQLSYLDLSFNFFITGTVPSEVGLLTDLVHFNVWSNILTGTVPTEVGDLTKLTWLDFDENSLTGSIPTELGRLSELEALGFRANNLTSTIPSELGQLENLFFLGVESMLLTGTIPTELSQLTNITSLALSENRLTGCLPSEVGKLTKLTFLGFGTNSLNGTIPTEIGYLTELNSLVGQNNGLTGEFPLEVYRPLLERIDFSNNSLIGTIPTEIAVLSPKLVYFSVWGNFIFAGTLPTELGLLTSMTSFDVFNNRFTGTVPSQLEEMTNLATLILVQNFLSGSIPAGLCSRDVDIYIDCEEVSCSCCFGWDGFNAFLC